MRFVIDLLIYYLDDGAFATFSIQFQFVLSNKSDHWKANLLMPPIK